MGKSFGILFIITSLPKNIYIGHVNFLGKNEKFAYFERYM